MLKTIIDRFLKQSFIYLVDSCSQVALHGQSLSWSDVHKIAVNSKTFMHQSFLKE